MFPNFNDYCQVLADLPTQFTIIKTSTLQAYTIGKYIAEVEGKLTFTQGYTLNIWELLDLSDQMIRKYSYELDQNGRRVWWYDPMAHPEKPSLQLSFPHHKHVHPNIKQNRIPAPEISFTEPNLPFLLMEIEGLLK